MSLKILDENLVDVAEISISLGTENAQFPLINIQNESPSLKFRSVGNSVKIVFDFTQTRPINSVALIGDTLSGLDITSASIKLSVSTDFTSSTPYSLVIDGANNFAYVELTEISRRYAELTVTGNGSFCQVSNIFIGKRTELLYNGLATTSFKYGNQDMSSVSESRYGQRFIDKRGLRKSLSGSIENANREEIDVIDSILLAHGVSTPLWMLVDSNSDVLESGFGKLSVYGYLEKLPDWSSVGGGLFSTSLSIEAAI